MKSLNVRWLRKRTIAILNKLAAEEDARQAAEDKLIDEMNAVMADMPYQKKRWRAVWGQRGIVEETQTPGGLWQ